MKILVATSRTQKKRKSDFTFCREGELVTFAMECDGERIDGGCGCRRAMSGMETLTSTTTMLVIDSPLTPEDLRAALRVSFLASGWDRLLSPKMFAADLERDAKGLERLANHFDVGTIVEKRGKTYKERRVA